MTTSPFEHNGRNLVVIDVGVTGPDPHSSRACEIAAVDTATGQRWNITIPPDGDIADNAELILALGDLAQGLEGNTLGGFDPTTASQFLANLLTAVDLTPSWNDLVDIRQLTAGALGIPPTSTPSIEQTCNLWGAPNPYALYTAERAVTAAAQCFDALAHYAAAARHAAFIPYEASAFDNGKTYLVSKATGPRSAAKSG